MKKFFAVLIAAVMVFTFGQSAVSAQGKILVAYFSRVGNEYGVGNIKKGNTAIVAEIIAQKLGADLFEIKPVKSYPVDYDECTKIASREKFLLITILFLLEAQFGTAMRLWWFIHSLRVTILREKILCLS